VAGLDRGNANQIDYAGLEVGDAPEVSKDTFFEDHVNPFAVALFDPAVTSINSLQRQARARGIGIGGEKATRLWRVAEMVRAAAAQMGYICLPDHSQNDPGMYSDDLT
jgi:hypothetical protein